MNSALSLMRNAVCRRYASSSLIRLRNASSIVFLRGRNQLISEQSKSVQNLKLSESAYFCQGGSVRRYSDDRANQNLTYEELVALVKGGDIQLFDVREPSELQETGKIPGATNIPIGSLLLAMTMTEEAFVERYRVARPRRSDRNVVFYGMGPIKSSAALDLIAKVGELGQAFLLKPDEFQDMYDVKMPGKQDDNVIFYCLGGVRSAGALAMVNIVGFEGCRHFPGGWQEWAKRQD